MAYTVGKILIEKLTSKELSKLCDSYEDGSFIPNQLVHRRDVVLGSLNQVLI